jgi:hypothetical protein
LRKQKALGLQRLLKDNPTAKKAVQMCMALALLPADEITCGYHEIRRYVKAGDLLVRMGKKVLRP